ncbi:hypothetical protein ACU4GD_40145 [Cupriavidus basilensis]
MAPCALACCCWERRDALGWHPKLHTAPSAGRRDLCGLVVAGYDRAGTRLFRQV